MMRGPQCVSAVAFLSMMMCSTVVAQSTAITYRGRLAQNGTPVSASADFEFSLWDSAGAGCPPVGGTRLGAVQVLTNVSVDEGLFTVLLNSAAEFGPTAFDGSARWIQIAVRSPAGSGQFVTLCPRQPITAVPYALFSFNGSGGGGDTFWAASGANNIYNTNSGNVGIGTPNPTNRLSVAGNADVSGSFTAASFTGGGAGLTGLNANNLGSGTVPSARLSGTYSNALTFSNASNSFTGSGAGLTALNASNISTGTLANARTTGASTNTPNTLVLRDGSGNFSAGTITGTFSGNGAALTALNADQIATGNVGIARMPTGGAWGLTSTLNVDANTFIVDPANDRIGLGIATPEQRLHMYSNVTGQSETLRIESRNFAGIDLVGDRSNLSGEPGGAFVRLFQDGGGVGGTIGVQAILGLVQLADEDGSGRSMPGTLANSLLLANLFSTGTLHFGTGNIIHMTLRNTGRLGIGTNAPARMLHLKGAEGFMRIDRLQSSGGTGLLMHQYNDNAGTEEPWKTFGLFAGATGANDGRFSIADLGTAVSGGGTDRFVIDNSGKVGMNISTPTANLHVRSIGGEAMNTLTLSHSTTDKSSQILLSENNVQHGMYLRYDGLSNKLQVLGLNNFSNTDVHMEIDRDTGRLEMFRSVSPGNVIRTVRLQSSDDTDQGSSFELYKGDGTRTIYMNAEEGLGRGADITIYNNSGVGTIQLDADYGDTGIGRVLTQVLEITGGADFSEQFDVLPARVAIADQAVKQVTEIAPEPGHVVCIDPDNPGKLVVSTVACDRTVAGVISGAGGVRPGMIMGQSGSVADGEHPVALSGRVYVSCDASHDAIRPGDLLTTSGTPGHAMRVVDHEAARGAIIGKAMTALDKGETGLVLVLVSLQ